MKPLNYLVNTLILISIATISGFSFAESPLPPTSPAISTVSGKININTANAQMLASTLKGIGLKKAEAIIEYRKTYGDFHNIQELADVSGIGQSTLEKNAGAIAVK